MTGKSGALLRNLCSFRQSDQQEGNWGRVSARDSGPGQCLEGCLTTQLFVESRNA